MLTELANKYGSDKGDQNYDAHHYTRVYEALFSRLRRKPLRLLEIGLLHPKDPRWKGTDIVPHKGGAAAIAAPSLQMWSEYFTSGQIHGFDINDFSDVWLERCTIHRGDSGNRADLTQLTASGPFDIIIDDGSHASIHQQTALGTLFDAVRPGGFYVIEDLQWQPRELESPSTPKTRVMLNRFLYHNILLSPHIQEDAAHRIMEGCKDLMIFDSLSPTNIIHGRDALAVIRKKSVRVR